MPDPRLGEVVSTDPLAGDVVSTDPYAGLDEREPDSPWGGVKRFASALNPWPIVPMAAESLADLSRGAGLAVQGKFSEAGDELYNAAAPVRAALNAQDKVIADSRAAYGRGDYITGAAKSIYGALPIIGPALAEAGDLYAEGRPWEATGQTLGVGASAVAPELLKGPLSAAGRRLRVPALFPAKNPTDIAAIQYAESRGMELPASTAAGGNDFLRALEEGAGHTLTGFGPVRRARRRLAAAFTRESEALGARAAPGGPLRRAEAGEQLQGSLQARADRLGAVGDVQYDALRAIEADPAELRSVTVHVPSIDANGNTVLSAVTKDMPMPVDLRRARGLARTLVADIERSMPIAQQQLSDGLKALRNLVNEEEFKPASVVDQDLSAMKALLREKKSLRPGGRRLLNIAIGEIEDALGTTLANATDPRVSDIMHLGRRAVAAKYDALRVLKGLKVEPGHILRQVVAYEDGSINRLQGVIRQAPLAARRLGRAWLQEQFDLATAEGQFAHGQRISANWKKLGPKTKALLYGPQLTSDLDKFFHVLSRSSELANPSKTALTLTALESAGQFALAFTHPLTGVKTLLGPYAIAKLLHSPLGVRTLTEGLTLPVSNKLASSTTALRLLQLSSQAGDREREDDEDAEIMPDDEAAEP